MTLFKLTPKLIFDKNVAPSKQLNEKQTCLMQNVFPQMTNAVKQNKADLVTFDMD